MHWAHAYIGQEYEPTLAGNCLGLARRVYRETFGRDLVGLLGLVHAVKRGELPAVEVAIPEDGDLVVMGTAAHRPARHVGLYVHAAGMPASVLHADDVNRRVVLSRMRLIRIAWPLVIFLRPTWLDEAA